MGRVPGRSTNDEATEHNRDVFDQAEVVNEYTDEMVGLMPGEQAMFDEYLVAGSSVLDLGVGGGRTTPYLAERASRYVGLDFAPRMVDACRSRFPDLDFVVGDASDLRAFRDGEFDAVVFSWNGIDCIHPEERRLQCLAEVQRVLRAGGTFFFSTHNARYILQRPEDRRIRVRRLARPSYLRTVVSAALPGARRLGWRAFWTGHGYVADRSHGGLTTYIATPAVVVEQGRRTGFEELRMLPSTYPEMAHGAKVSWYYFAWSRP